MKNHFKAYARATWRAGRAARRGDFAAAERWDRYAERQLKLASLVERALDVAELRRENERLDIATFDLENQRNKMTRDYWARAKKRNAGLEQEIQSRSAEYLQMDEMHEARVAHMARQRAQAIREERAGPAPLEPPAHAAKADSC